MREGFEICPNQFFHPPPPVLLVKILVFLKFWIILRGSHRNLDSNAEAKALESAANTVSWCLWVSLGVWIPGRVEHGQSVVYGLAP